MEDCTQPMAENSHRLIVDAHADITWNWLDADRHPGDSALESRRRESHTVVPATMGVRTTGLPQWVAGRVGIIFATVFVMPQRRARSALYRQTYEDVEEAHIKGRQQLDAYRRLTEEEPRFTLITTAPELEGVVAAWTRSGSDPQVGLVLLLEGGDPIREPAEVHWWYERGLRLVGPAWAGTRYAGSCDEPGPLTPLGKSLLAEMANLNMVLDLSHMADQACLEALDLYSGPIIASHSNPRRLCDVPRNLSDDLICRLAERSGVMGIVPFNGFLKAGWQRGDPRDGISIQRVADAVDHVAQLTGASENVGLGTDLDGGFGAESIPVEMDTAADLPLIGDALRERGYSPADLERVMHGSWLGVLRRSLP